MREAERLRYMTAKIAKDLELEAAIWIGDNGWHSIEATAFIAHLAEPKGFPLRVALSTMIGSYAGGSAKRQLQKYIDLNRDRLENICRRELEGMRRDRRIFAMGANEQNMRPQAGGI